MAITKVVNVKIPSAGILQYEGGIEENLEQMKQDLGRVFDNMFEYILGEVEKAIDEDLINISKISENVPAIINPVKSELQQEELPQLPEVKPEVKKRRQPKYVSKDYTGNNYVVKSGDGLGLLTITHNTTESALMKLNNIIDEDKRIYVGEELIIPGYKNPSRKENTNATSEPEIKEKPAEEVIGYPRSVLIYDATLGLHGGYKFTQLAAHLLSLVSGVSRVYIDNTVVQKRAVGQYRPFYSAKEGGGAIVLGSGVLNSNITYTENFFNDDPTSYNGHGYGQDVMEWLSLSAHEVGHLPQISKAGGFFNYVLGFISEYIKSGHDADPSEIEADKGYQTFKAFNSFVNKTYGDGLIEKLFNSDKKESLKIEIITNWWNAYKATQRKTTNPFLK